LILSAKLPVTGIAKTRQDIAVLIQTLIDRCQVDWDIRMGCMQPRDSLWRSN